MNKGSQRYAQSKCYRNFLSNHISLKNYILSRLFASVVYLYNLESYFRTPSFFSILYLSLSPCH
jgi:hypothetical protein